MVIDIHTHVFPDAMSEKTIALLADKADLKAYTDGKVTGLLASMDAGGIDCSVIMPVVTAPRQFDSINRFAADINERYAHDKRNGLPRLISFGGIHPDSDDYKLQLDTLKSMGFKGIKLHPDYQGVFFNDIRYKRIVSYAAELDMLVLVHAGLDVGMPDPIHCTPKMSDEVIRETESDKLILAHLGGFNMWDEVEELLVGRNIYMDMAVIPAYISDEQFVRIVNNHGSDKILFGSDSPWSGQKESVDWLRRQALTETAKESIFCNNAARLLKQPLST